VLEERIIIIIISILNRMKVVGGKQGDARVGTRKNVNKQR
jgi:hypothetical protein